MGEMVEKNTYPLCFMSYFSQKLITAYGTSFKQNKIGTSEETDFTEHFDNSKWVLMCISNSSLEKFSYI